MITASVMYSIDYKGASPWRGGWKPGWTQPHFPHDMRITNGGPIKNYDLNRSLFKPYLNVERGENSSGAPIRTDGDKVLFCPGELFDVRFPDQNTNGYGYQFISYQYYVMPQVDASLWLSERNGVDVQPDLTRMSDVQAGRYAMWGCITLSNATETSWLGHDAPVTSDPPTGMNACYFDGSAGWSSFPETEQYYYKLNSGQYWYWPTPR
jgi:hypothetical protein